MIHVHAVVVKNTNSAAVDSGKRGQKMICRNKVFALFAAILMIPFAATTGFAVWDSSEEIRRLNREAPSIDSFKGAEGLVWLENNNYKMLIDGSMEKLHYTVVMLGETIPESLTDIRIPVPGGGLAEIIDASWYNPMTVMKEGSLRVEEETLPGGAVVKRISTPNTAAGRVVVIAVREVYAKKYSVDGVVAMAGSLPCWEQNLTVEVSEGEELVWTGREVNEPQISKDGLTVKYKWTVMNQQPWYGEALIEYKRPFVAFGSKKGVNQAIAMADAYAKVIKVPPLPAFAKSGDKVKNGVRLMSWLAEPARTLQGYPNGWIRQNEQIPDNGPWTLWEQTLILNRWLEIMGWNSEVWWQTTSDLSEDIPAAKDLFIAPVLSVAADSSAKKKTYYQAGQASEFGVASPGITGSTLYRVNNKEDVERKIVSPGSVSNHRLSMFWKLSLNEDGVAEGTLEVMVSGGWAELFSGSRPPEKRNLGEFLLRRINFAMPGMELTTKEVEQDSNGYKMELAVKCVPGIIHGNNLLLRLPGGVPHQLGEMIGRESDYTFHFPFIIDQKVRMGMPCGYRIVQPPAIVSNGQGSKAVLKQSVIHWPKKAELLADSTWTVKTRTVDTGLALLLKEQLAACLRWPALNLPFRK